MPPSSSTSNNPQRRSRHSIPGRMGMRKWLEHLLDDGLCEGLAWEDKAKKIFSIVWKHASSHGFDGSKHADVFLQWARYKGRTAEKEERNQRRRKSSKTDYDSKYKSNFRCALHSLIDCVEINCGKEESPQKFFKFIDSSDPQYKVRRDKKRNSYNKKAKKRPYEDTVSEEQDTECKKERLCVKTQDLKGETDSNEDNIITVQGAQFGTALEEDQRMMESVSDNCQQSSDQVLTSLNLYPSPSHETGNASLPLITLQQKKETTGQMEIVYGDWPSSSLPNFEALGMKDQYGPKSYITSTLLASGGDVAVKKVTEEKPEFQEPFVVLPVADANTGTIVTTNVNDDIPVYLLELISADNSSQEVSDMSNIMSTPQVQEPFNNPFLPVSEGNGVITQSTIIVNDIEIIPAESYDDLDFTSEPFCDSF